MFAVERVAPALIAASMTCLMWWSLRTTTIERNFFDKLLRGWFSLDPYTNDVITRRLSIFPGIDAFRPELLNLLDTYFLMVLLAIAVSPLLNLKTLSRFLIALTLGLLFICIGPYGLITYVSLHLAHFHFTRKVKSPLFGFGFVSTIFLVPFFLNQYFYIPFINWGLGLFVLEAPRLLLYQRENADGVLPPSPPISHYLLLFFSPACSTSFAPQGYSHVFSRFRKVSFRTLYWGGAVAMLEAFVSFALGHSLIRILAETVESQTGLTLDPELTRALLRLEALPEASAFGSSAGALLSAVFSGCLHLGIVFMMLMTANQFRIALWRFLGFNVDSHFKFPYFGSSLAETWMRFSVHYRMCLTRVFYEPVFWRLERLSLPARVSLSTLFSIVCGGILFHSFQRGSSTAFSPSTFWYSLAALPYYLALGIGVGTSQMRILRSGRKRSTSGFLRFQQKALGASFVILFLGFTHLLASPETGFDGWRVLRLMWSTIWNLRI